MSPSTGEAARSDVDVRSRDRSTVPRSTPVAAGNSDFSKTPLPICRSSLPTRSSNMRQPFPLQWPAGWVRTEPDNRERALFRVTLTEGIQDLLYELRLMGAANVVIT